MPVTLFDFYGTGFVISDEKTSKRVRLFEKRLKKLRKMKGKKK